MSVELTVHRVSGIRLGHRRHFVASGDNPEFWSTELVVSGDHGEVVIHMFSFDRLPPIEQDAAAREVAQ